MRSDDYEDDALMDGQNVSLQDADDDLDDGDFTDTDVLDSSAFADPDAFDDDGDFDDETPVRIEVDDLVAEFDAESEMPAKSASSRLRKRLEAIAERKRRHQDLLDFADYDI